MTTTFEQDTLKLREACTGGIRNLADLRARVRRLENQLPATDGESTLVPLMTVEEAQARAMIANFYDYLGDYALAALCVRPCEAQFEALQQRNSDGDPALTIALSRVDYRLRGFIRAEDRLRTALALAKQYHNQFGEGLVLFELARVYHRRRMFPQAEEATHGAKLAFRKALPGPRSNYRVALCDFLLGSIAYSKGLHEQAASFLATARASMVKTDTIHIGRITELEGRITRARSDNAGAEALFHNARKLFETNGHRVYLASVHNDLAHLCLRTGDFTAADAHLSIADQTDTEKVHAPKNLYFRGRLLLHQYRKDAAAADAAGILKRAEDCARLAIQCAHERRAPSVKAEANILLSRILLEMKPGRTQLEEVQRCALKARELNTDEYHRPISAKTEIAFNLIMAERELAETCSLLVVVKGYLNYSERLMRDVRTEFLVSWHKRICEKIEGRKDDFRVPSQEEVEEPDLGIDKLRQRLLFWDFIQAARRSPSRRGGADIGQMAETVGNVRGGVERRRDNWIANDGGKADLIGVTPEVLDEILMEYGVPKVRGGQESPQSQASKNIVQDHSE